MPLISVIVPVYKVEPYLKECVDSILNQTFTDFELILVDDGSPDNCPQICDEYARKDKRVIVIHKENGGVSSARNAGLDYVFAHSDSQYISFVDSDDILRCDTFNRTVNILSSDNSDIVRFSLSFIKEDDEWCPVYEFSNSKIRFNSSSEVEFYIQNIIMPGKIGFMCGMSMFKKNIIKNNNIRFLDSVRMGEDWHFLVKYFYYVKSVSFCDDTLYYYRRRSGSATKISDNISFLNDMVVVSKDLIECFSQSSNDALLILIHYYLITNELFKFCYINAFQLKLVRKAFNLIGDKAFFRSFNKKIIEYKKNNKEFYTLSKKQQGLLKCSYTFNFCSLFICFLVNDLFDKISKKIKRVFVRK